MKVKSLLISILFVYLGVLLGCQSSTEPTQSNGCSFAPATSNFGADGPNLGYCPTCFLEFSHRDQLYSFKFNEVEWLGRGDSHVYEIDQLFKLSFPVVSEHSQLFNSLKIRTPVMHPDSLTGNQSYRIVAGFQIQNYCKQVFYPTEKANLLDSYHEISRIELKEDFSNEDYTFEEYLVTGMFNTYIVVNGLHEPIKGNYKLVLKLTKKKSKG